MISNLFQSSQPPIKENNAEKQRKLSAQQQYRDELSNQLQVNIRKK